MKKLLSLSLVSLLTIYFFCACGPKKPKLSSSDKNKIDSVYNRLSVLYDSVKSFDSNKNIFIGKDCTAKGLGKDSIKKIHVFKLDELEKFKFANDSIKFYEIGKKNQNSIWRWASTARYLLEEDFGKLPSDMNGKELESALWSIKKKSWILNDQIYPILVTKEGNMPEIIDDNTFKGGYYYGKLFLVNAKDYSLLCATEIIVESSDEIDFKKYKGKLKVLNKNEDNVLRNDFKEAFKAKLWDALYGFDPDFGGF